MRLSIFRQRSNNNGASSDAGVGYGGGSGTAASTPTAQKKTNRLSSMFSSPVRSKLDITKMEISQPLESLSNSISSPPFTLERQRPATAGAPPPTASSNNNHSPPMITTRYQTSSNSTPPPLPHPPASSSIPSRDLVSSDGPTLPTSPPDDLSFQASSSTIQPPHAISNADGPSDISDDPYNLRQSHQPHPVSSRPFTAFTSRPARDFGSSSSPDKRPQSGSWSAYSQRWKQLPDEGSGRQAGNAQRWNQTPNESREHHAAGGYDDNQTNVTSPITARLSTKKDHHDTPATSFRAPVNPQYSYPDEDQISYGDNSFTNSSMQHRLSSPSAAAAQRSKMRSASSVPKSTKNKDPPLASPPGGTLSGSRRLTSAQGEPTRVSSVHLASSTENERALSDSKGRSASVAEANPGSRRPEYLQQHQSSQRSSGQSFQSRESQTTIGAEDFAASGAATPGRDLPRLPSNGSLGSSASGGTEIVTPRGLKRSRNSMLQRTIKGNTEGESGSKNTTDQDFTPRARPALGQEPSETVVARHVRDVEVPETVARAYKSSYRTESSGTNFLTASSPFTQRSKNAFSLKDQNAKIDKLTKENFDLKLKIHFLYQALQDRSDEGVKDTIAKNAQLQADLVQVKKENQTLRKRIRQLERGPTFEKAGSIAPSYHDSEDGSRSVLTAQLEEEMTYLQQRMQDLETENAQLSQDGQYSQLYSRLDEEVAKRKEAERTVREMQQEIARLQGNPQPRSQGAIQDSNNDISKGFRARSTASRESKTDVRDEESLSGGTLVNQLRQENDDLKRSLGAQASMLTSRNRERERLQQEIEDLKLVQRRGGNLGPGSAAGDSILDRSVSRAQARSASGNSDSERGSQLSDPERDRYEDMQAGLRDENNRLRMQVQDLERELDSLGEGAEHIQALQKERDDAVHAINDADVEIEQLNTTIDQLDELILMREDEISPLKDALRRKEKEVENFRADLNTINESFEMLVEDREMGENTIQSLQKDIVNANGELEAMESKMRDLASAKERLEVQQESSQNEITFLREEQEGDMIKISELQSALEAAQMAAKSHSETAREFTEMQKTSLQASDDIRELRKRLKQREGDLRILQEKLDEATGTLEEAVGSFDGTRESYNEEISKLQQTIEVLEHEVRATKYRLDEKDRLLSARDALLETSSHESRRLNELLTKERQGRKHDRNEVERQLARAKGTPEAKVLALEQSRENDKQRLLELEKSLNERLSQREGLLCGVWNRLSSICNSEGLLEQQQPMSVDDQEMTSLGARFPPVLDAVASHVATFRHKLDHTEKLLTTDFTALSNALSQRTTRLEALETRFASSKGHQNEQYGVLRQKYDMAKNENRMLRHEIKFMKQGSFALPGLPSPLDDMDGQFDVGGGGGGGGIGRGDTGSAAEQIHTRPNTTTSTTIMAPEGPGPDAASPTIYHGPLSKEKGLYKGVTGEDSIQDRHRQKSRPTSKMTESRSFSTTVLPTQSNSLITQSQSNMDIEDDDLTPTPTKPRPPHRSSSTSASTALALPLSSAVPATSTSTMTMKADRTWAMRLDEMKKRMRMEREGRLLDRQSARTRLVESENEKNRLRDELNKAKEKEKDREKKGGVSSDRTDVDGTDKTTGQYERRDSVIRSVNVSDRGEASGSNGGGGGGSGGGGGGSEV